MINVHHFPDQIIEYVRSQRNFGIRIEFSDERDDLLETGGGVRKAAYFSMMANLSWRIMLIFCQT